MTNRIKISIFAILSILVGLYPVLYFVLDRDFALLQTKNPEILSNAVYNVFFNIHIFTGGLALLSGWPQFVRSFRLKYIHYHRLIGIFYTFICIISGLSAIYISFYATGGTISTIGFLSLGLVWVFTTTRGFLLAKNKKIGSHRKMMTYSYAASFAAVTLRLWLPLLILIFSDFTLAYQAVAWLCWVPNIAYAYYINSK